MRPDCCVCYNTFVPGVLDPLVLRRCGHVLCRGCLLRVIASQNPYCPNRCHEDVALRVQDAFPLVLLLRPPNEVQDTPLSVIKRTSELHRARLASEERLARTKAELALLHDAVSTQVGAIAFRERRILHDRRDSTNIRYRVEEMRTKLRGLLRAIEEVRRGS